MIVCVVAFAPMSMASAAVLTVGDHGTYSDIQTAVNAALGAGSTEIRVEQGTYMENFYITSSFVSDDIEISGGWNAAFSSRSADASLTVIDGGAQINPVIGIYAAGGSILVDGLTITNGSGPTGGGIRVRPSGGIWVTISNNRIIGNSASGSLPSGGGVSFRDLTYDARLTLIDNVISGNTLENTSGGSASGGGVALFADADSAWEATGNRIIDNTCIAPSDNVFGCGASLSVNSPESSVFSDNLVRGNRTVIAAGLEVAGAGTSVYTGLTHDGSLTMRRNLWIDNRDLFIPAGYHIRASVHDDHSLEFSDSVIAGGPDKGIGLWKDGAGTARLTNLTVFDHSEIGVYMNVSGTVPSLYNTIIYASLVATDIPGNVDTGGNLVGVDPLFLDATTWDCHLWADSPALNSGDNSPPGGLGPSDADGGPRVHGGIVDVGAYEGVASLFRDGFEGGDTTQWSSVVP